MADDGRTIDGDGLLAELGAEQSERRTRLVALLTAFVLDQRVSDLLEPGEVVTLLTQAVTEDNARRVTERWLEPAWERHRARSEAEGDTVGDAVPEAQQAAIRRLLQQARLPKATWAKGAVDPQLVRDLLAPVLQQTLLGFVKRLPGLGGAEAGGGSGGGGGGASPLSGFAGAFGKRALERAGKLAEAGRGMLGGAFDERVQQVAREFSRGALGGMREALRERLRSDEGKKLVGKIREQVFDRLLEAPVAALMDDAEAVPLAEVREVAAPVVAFNAERAFVRRAVREEIQAWVDLEGARTVGELLDEAGLGDAVRDLAARRLDPLLRDFFSSYGFAAWLLGPGASTP